MEFAAPVAGTQQNVQCSSRHSARPATRSLKPPWVPICHLSERRAVGLSAAQNPLEVALRVLDRVNPLALRDGARLPNSFDVVVRTLQIMQYELGNVRAGEADVLVTPTSTSTGCSISGRPLQ